MHWNLMNDEEFGSIKFLKLKYRRVDQIIQTLCRIGSPQKLGPPSLICRNFKSLTKKILWIIQNTWKSNEWGRIWVLESLKIEIQKGGPNNSAVLQKCLVAPKKSSPLDSSNSGILQNWFHTSSLEIGSPLQPKGISENWRNVSTLNHVKYII